MENEVREFKPTARVELTGVIGEDWEAFKKIVEESGGMDFYMITDESDGNMNLHFINAYPQFEDMMYEYERVEHTKEQIKKKTLEQQVSIMSSHIYGNLLEIRFYLEGLTDIIYDYCKKK